MQNQDVYGVVYRITNLVNGKRYHGQTIKTPQERWQSHLRDDSHCFALRNALRKYGEANFALEIVATATSKDELDALERHWVSTSMSPVGYNLKDGGANGRPSEETRRRMSIASKAAQARPEVQAKISAGLKRAWAKPGAIERLRAASKEAANRPGVKERQRQKMVDVHARPGESEKRGEALKAAWAGYTDEERQHRMDSLKASYTDEIRQRISAQSKASMSDPEVKERHREAIIQSITPDRRAALVDQLRSNEADPERKAKRAAAIVAAHGTPEGKAKLARRRRRGESIEKWQERIRDLKSPSNRRSKMKDDMEELGRYTKDGQPYELIAFPKAGNKWELSFIGPFDTGGLVGAIDTIQPSDASFKKLVDGLDSVTLADVAVHFGFTPISRSPL